jgi:hypothetical protein
MKKLKLKIPEKEYMKLVKNLGFINVAETELQGLER